MKKELRYKLLLIFIICHSLFINEYLYTQNQKPEVVVQIGHAGYASSIAYSPDSRYALSGSYDNTLILWDINSGREVKTFSGHSNWVTSVSFSPNGKYALSGSRDNTLKLWDIISGKEIKTFSGHSNAVFSVAFSFDGNYALSGSLDKTLKLWNINSGEEIKTFLGHTGWIYSVAFSPDDKYALSGSYDGTLKLWDINSGTELRTFLGHNNRILSVAFSPDGKYVLSGGSENISKLWDINSGKELKTFAGCGPIAFSTDGNYILSGRIDTLVNFEQVNIKETLKLWDINSGKELKTFSGQGPIAFSPNGNNFLSGSDIKNLKLWDIHSGRELKTFSGYTSGISSVAFSPDGNYALSGSYDKILRIWDLNSGIALKSFSGHTYQIKSVAISPDGQHILSSDGLKILLWDLKSEKEVISLSVPGTNSLAFSPDGQYVLSGNINVELWNIDSAKHVKTFLGNTDIVSSVAFSPDGKFALSGSSDMTLKLWNIISGEEVNSFSDDWGVNSVLFSPDGKYVLSGNNGGIMKLWNSNSGEIVKTFSGHTSVISSIAISPDGKYALSGSWDKTLKLWDLNLKEEVKTYLGHTSMINSVAFSSDNIHLLSGSQDCKMKLWDINTNNEIVDLIAYKEKDFLYITPDNYYLCTKGGLQSIAFVIDNQSYPPEQFDLQYNRPDIVLERIGLAPKELIDAYRKAYEKRLKKMKFKEENFNKDFHMPEMKLMNENIPVTTPDKNISFKIKAEDSKYLLDRINVYVNDVAIYGTDGIDLRDKQISTYENNVSLELSEGKNKIQISVLNDKGVESLKETVEINCESPMKKHDLYVVTIGASDYNDSRYKLRYAAKDANDIADLMLTQKDKYNEVKVTKLLDEDVTKENIQKVKEQLMQSKVDDEVILFIAGHGLLTKEFDYYYATSDIDFANPQTRGVTFEEIESLLDGIPARQKVLLMDTCHSGELDKEDLQIIVANEKTQEKGEPVFTREVNGIKVGRKNENEGFGLKNVSELMQEMFVDLRRGSGAAVISSSGGLEVSYEGGDYKNGFFTYAILEGIKTMNADLNKDGIITVSELRDYVSDKVEKLTKGAQKPTARRENLENDFKIW